MKYEHKAIIDAATREGKLPMEMAKELLAHDLLKSMVTSLRGHAVAFKNMTQQQQDAAIATMTDDLKAAIDTAARTIFSQNTKTVRMKLKSVAIGKSWKIVGEADGAEEFLHELADKTQDQSDVLVLLYERDFLQGLDAIQGEKDQKALPLDEAGKGTEKKQRAPSKPKADAKPIEITPGMLEQATEFVTRQQNTSVDALQNLLKINIDKAQAIHQQLEESGILSAPDEHGVRKLVKADQVPASGSPAAQHQPADPLAFVSDETYAEAKAKVISEKRISVSFLQSEFALAEEQAAAVMTRLEAEGVISEENELGGRKVLLEA